MYLISVYFDEKTDKKFRSLIKKTAEKTGNMFMIEHQVSPHITIAAIETRDEQMAIDTIQKCLPQIRQGELNWISIGTFFPNVIYAQPVLNTYLHELSVVLNQAFQELPDTKFSACYQPFCWLPHTTLGKQLTKEQMKSAFELMQTQFTGIKGRVVKMGIAKPNPHRDLKIWELDSDFQVNM